MTTIFIIASILASIGAAFLTVQCVRLADWLINKSIKHETEQKTKRFLPDADSDVWHPSLPSAPVIHSVRGRFIYDFKRLKEHEYILIYIGEGFHVTVDNGWKLENGLLFSPIADYAGDMTRQKVVDPGCISSFIVTKQRMQAE